MYTYIIIGCGSTGSYFTKNLYYFLSRAHANSFKEQYEIILIDDDIVEEKNMSNQYFFNYNIKSYKTHALCNNLLNPSNVIAYVDKFQNSLGSLKKDIKTQHEYIRIILCVDKERYTITHNIKTLFNSLPPKTATIYDLRASSAGTGVGYIKEYRIYTDDSKNFSCFLEDIEKKEQSKAYTNNGSTPTPLHITQNFFKYYKRYFRELTASEIWFDKKGKC